MATIIFDFDGTIADSFDYVADFLAGEAGLSDLSDTKRQELRGLSMAAMASKLGFHWWDGPKLMFKGRRRLNKSIKDLNSFAGMPELIRKLHAEGHELFVLSSNSTRNLKAFLHKHDIYQYILQIYGGVGMFSKGPALRKLLKQQNLEIANAVYVGDELRDIEAAQSIGLRAIAVSWGFANRDDLKDAKPAGLADTPEELLRVLEEV